MRKNRIWGVWWGQKGRERQSWCEKRRDGNSEKREIVTFSSPPDSVQTRWGDAERERDSVFRKILPLLPLFFSPHIMMSLGIDASISIRMMITRLLFVCLDLPGDFYSSPSFILLANVRMIVISIPPSLISLIIIISMTWRKGLSFSLMAVKMFFEVIVKKGRRGHQMMGEEEWKPIMKRRRMMGMGEETGERDKKKKKFWWPSSPHIFSFLKIRNVLQYFRKRHESKSHFDPWIVWINREWYLLTARGERRSKWWGLSTDQKTRRKLKWWLVMSPIITVCGYPYFQTASTKTIHARILRDVRFHQKLQMSDLTYVMQLKTWCTCLSCKKKFVNQCEAGKKVLRGRIEGCVGSRERKMYLTTIRNMRNMRSIRS